MEFSGGVLIAMQDMFLKCKIENLSSFADHFQNPWIHVLNKSYHPWGHISLSPGAT